MIVDPLIDSEDLRNRLMDVIKCANEEYQVLVQGGPTILSKEHLSACEDSVRIRLYSLFLDALGEQNDREVQDDYFIKRVRSFIGPLGRLIRAAELTSEARKTVAACLAMSIAAAAEDTRDMKHR